LEQVAKQYHRIGGVSPYNRFTQEQAHALEKLLKARGLAIPVVLGFAHSKPHISDTLTALARLDKTNLFAIIMAPHRSPASFDKYVKRVEDASRIIQAQGLPAPRVTYAPAWHARAGFIRALEDRVKEAYALLTEEEKDRHKAELIFTAHSIPRDMASRSSYVSHFEETANLVTQRVGMPYYHVAYTSRSGRPEEAWLEPDLTSFLERRGLESLAACVVAPIGFLVDHVEVLYDIDVLAQERAKRSGIHMVRAKTVGTHPSFIAMMSSLVEEAIP
jgi:ferrochelatase